MEHINLQLTTNKLFLGVSYLFMSFGSRYILADITPCQEYILKQPLIKYFIIFCMCFVTTRDLKTSIILTFSLYLIIYYLCNENSRFNVIPIFIQNKIKK